MRIYIGNGDSPRLDTDRCTDRAPKGPQLFKVIGPGRTPRCYAIGSNCVESSDIHLFHTSYIKQMPRISMLMFGITSIRLFFLIRYSLGSEPTKFGPSSHVYSQTTTAITI